MSKLTSELHSLRLPLELPVSVLLLTVSVHVIHLEVLSALPALPELSYLFSPPIQARM